MAVSYPVLTFTINCVQSKTNIYFSPQITTQGGGGAGGVVWVQNEFGAGATVDTNITVTLTVFNEIGDQMLATCDIYTNQDYGTWTCPQGQWLLTDVYVQNVTPSESATQVYVW